MTFARMLNEAHKVTGNVRSGEACPDILIYNVTTATPRGSLAGHPFCLWPYLCDYPLDGWSTETLKLVNELTANPMGTLYLGAGSGRVVKWLNGAGMACVGIDIDPDALELMERRGVPCEEMDALDMTYEDNSHERVIVHGDGLLDSFEDVGALLAEAGRVASDTLVVTGYEMDEEARVAFDWGFTWEQRPELVQTTYYAHPATDVVAALVAAGMTPVRVMKWSDDDAGPGGNIFGVQYLIEARW